MSGTSTAGRNGDPGADFQGRMERLYEGNQPVEVIRYLANHLATDDRTSHANPTI